MGRLVHISQMNPETNEGGVAQFARHLKIAFPELEFMHNAKDNHWALAEQTNLGRLRRGELDGDCVVIADGYYARGLAGKVGKLIVVCHGTYAGWLRDAQRYYVPGFEKSYKTLLDRARGQEQAFKEADVVVSVSGFAREELHDIYRVPSHSIPIGVDTDKFTTDTDVARSDISATCVCGNDRLKGADIVDALRNDGVGIAQLGYEGNKHERWPRYEIAILPSRHESGPYALLEAMACGLHVIAGKTGLLVHDIPPGIVQCTNDYYHGTFKRMIEAWVSGKFTALHSPAAWVRENLSLDLFCRCWREFMEEIL